MRNPEKVLREPKVKKVSRNGLKLSPRFTGLEVLIIQLFCDFSFLLALT